MNNTQRIEIYTRGLKYKTVDGYYRLTPKQHRRVIKKSWREEREYWAAKTKDSVPVTISDEFILNQETVRNISVAPMEIGTDDEGNPTEVSLVVD